MINGSRILKTYLDSDLFIILSVIFLCVFARGLWLVFKHKSSGKGTWHLISPIFFIFIFIALPQFDQYGTCTATTARLESDLSNIHRACWLYWEDQGSNPTILLYIWNKNIVEVFLAAKDTGSIATQILIITGSRPMEHQRPLKQNIIGPTPMDLNSIQWIPGEI